MKTSACFAAYSIPLLYPFFLYLHLTQSSPVIVQDRVNINSARFNSPKKTRRPPFTASTSQKAVVPRFGAYTPEGVSEASSVDVE